MTRQQQNNGSNSCPEVEQRLPFPVSVCSWNELVDSDREFFCFADDYLPLHPNHAAQIGLLLKDDAKRVYDWAFSAIPSGWPDQIGPRFSQES